MAATDPDDNARKKGSAELLILAQLEGRPRHGYEMGVRRKNDGSGVFFFLWHVT